MAKKTKEEVVANKMIDLVSDVSLNLDEVGENLADNTSSLMYNRLEAVFDSAKDRKENGYTREQHHTFFLQV